MLAPVIPTLPEAPSPSDSRQAFNAKAFPFVGALGGFGDALNELSSWLNTNINVNVPVNISSTSANLSGGYTGGYIRFTNTSPKTLNVLPEFSEPQQDGAHFLIVNTATGDLTLSPGLGVTINNNVELAFNSSAILQRISENTYDLVAIGGEFSSIVTSVNGRTGDVVLDYDTPTQAALASLPVGAKYSTKGSVSVGDGGGSDFIVEAASGTANIYRRTLLANGNHGVLQTVNGFVRPEQYGIFTGSNLASLRLVNPPVDGALFKMDSRLAGQNVDGGIYYWNASSTIPDDNKNVIAVTGVATGRWLKQTEKITNRDPIGNVAPRLRGSIADGFGGDSIAVIGDSISHGANVADIHNDSYVGIFRKLANLEFGATNTGFVPINWQIANSEGTYSEIHSVVATGSWTNLTLADASASICGFIRRSSSAGAKLTVTVPTISTHFKVLYQGGTGGVFEISKDGGSTVTATITSSGSNETLKTSQYTLVDLGLGSSEITLTVVSGQVDIVGIEYVDQQTNFAVNNYSQSGRKIEFIDDAVITKACLSNRMLVWSLGFNDSGLAAGASRDTVLAKLDFLAAQAKANFTKLVICDFIWGQEQNHWLRSKFREVVEQVEGAVYIPFPDLFYRSGFIISASTLNSTYNFTNDNTHPTVTGHKLIAETLARALGFTFSTKKSAEMFDPIWRPITLINGWVNTFNSSVYVTAYRRHGNSVQLRIAVNKTGASSGVIGNLPATINIPLRSYIPVADSASAIFIVDLNLGVSSNITLKDYAGLAGANVSAQISHSINNNLDFSRFD